MCLAEIRSKKKYVLPTLFQPPSPISCHVAHGHGEKKRGVREKKEQIKNTPLLSSPSQHVPKMPAPPLRHEKPQRWLSIVGLVLVYSLCNSMLLVLNKMAVTRVPAPSVVLLAQLWSCALFIYLLKLLNVIQFGKVSAEKLRSFGIIAVGFIAVLYCNMTTLKVRCLYSLFFFRSLSFSFVCCL